MNNKNKQSNNVSHPLRLIAGVYLLYLAQSLLKKWAELDNKLLFGIFIGIFGVIGILLLITSGLALLRNRNRSGNAMNAPDVSMEEPQTTEDEAQQQSEASDLVNEEDDKDSNP